MLKKRFGLKDTICLGPSRIHTLSIPVCRYCKVHVYILNKRTFYSELLLLVVEIRTPASQRTSSLLNHNTLPLGQRKSDNPPNSRVMTKSGPYFIPRPWFLLSSLHIHKATSSLDLKTFFLNILLDRSESQSESF
jgi:hypothetical protein